MIYAKYDCILIWLRCQIFNKIIKQLKSKVTLENLRGTVLKAKIFDIVAGHFHCMFESVWVWFDLCYKCLLHVGISLEFTTYTKPFISVDLDKIFAVVYDFFQHRTLSFASVSVRHVKRMADLHASWTPHQHLYLPSLYNVYILSI